MNRKPSTNLTLDRKAKRLAKQMSKEDNRPSLVNMLEHLVWEEAKRRGLLVPKRNGQSTK